MRTISIFPCNMLMFRRGVNGLCILQFCTGNKTVAFREVLFAQKANALALRGPMPCGSVVPLLLSPCELEPGHGLKVLQTSVTSLQEKWDSCRLPLFGLAPVSLAEISPNLLIFRACGQPGLFADKELYNEV